MAHEQTMESILRTITKLSEREDDAAQIPDCEQCGYKMSLLATLAQICNRPTLNVFRCVPCSSIYSSRYAAWSLVLFVRNAKLSHRPLRNLLRVANSGRSNLNDFLCYYLSFLDPLDAARVTSS
jgi:hypothetical protein